jgi:peptidoglycan hydrolase CwlO-like protein
VKPNLNFTNACIVWFYKDCEIVLRILRKTELLTAYRSRRDGAAVLAKNWKILLLIAGQLILYTAATVGNTGGPLIPGVSAEETDDQARPESQKERQTRIEEFKTRQKNIRREIEKGRQEVEAISRREADVIKRLNQVELAYHNSKRRAALLSKEIKELDNEISAALQTSEALRRRIQANEEYVAKRLVAMYKMNWLGTIDLLASADSMQEFIQRKAALRYILAHDEKIRAEMVENRAELEKVLDRLETHKIQKSARADEYKKQMRQMAEERSLRQKLLSDIRDQKALELAAINALSQAADELDAKNIFAARRDCK